MVASYAKSFNMSAFYRAMYVVLARYCCRMSSVRLSVRDVDVPWAYRLD